MIDTRDQRLFFKRLVERFEEPALHGITFNADQCAVAQATLWHVSGLLDDIGVNPDRKYTVAEVDAMAAAIEQALGGAL